MKKKSINKALQSVTNHWINSIKDDGLKELVKDNVIVTGGSIASMLLGEEVNDYDIYFRNKVTAKAVAEFYVSEFLKNSPDHEGLIDIEDEDETSLNEGRIRVVIQSSGVASIDPNYYDEDDEEDFILADATVDTMAQAFNITHAGNQNSKKKTKSYVPIFLSSNAIMLSNQIQLIFRFYGDPDTIHENYDFVHCKNYWTSWDKKVVTNNKSLECLLAKELIYEGSKYPLCSVIRTRKFITRGWTITAGEYLKMLWQVSQLDLTDLDVLEDQLTGVDSAYFDQLIGLLRSAKDEGITIDDTYIAEVVDKVFNNDEIETNL